MSVASVDRSSLLSAAASAAASAAVGTAPTSSGVGAMLVMARRGLAEAELAHTSAERYAAAHLAALRGAAAVLAARARPASGARRGRPLSAWTLLAGVAPELGEWAEFFAAGARKRALAETGLPGSVTTREADDLLRDATTFLEVVETKLGISSQPQLFVALQS